MSRRNFTPSKSYPRAFLATVALPIAAAAWPVSQTQAQAFNIEFQSPDNAMPSASFGGAAGQPGTWVNAYFGSDQILSTTAGEVSGVTLSTFQQGNEQAFGFTTSNTGDYAALLDDGIAVYPTDCEPSDLLFAFVRGVTSGTYRVYTYAGWPLEFLGDTYVGVNSAPEALITGGTPGDAFVEGVTHSVHEVTVTNGNILVFIHGTGDNGSFLSGIQIVPLALDQCTVTQLPADQTLLKDQTATFSAAVSGNVGSYQWTKDGVPLVNARGISGVNSPTLTVTEARPSDNGAYALRYLCGGSYETTASANLTVIDCTGDITGDGIVDLTDLTTLLTHFGQICP